MSRIPVEGGTIPEPGQSAQAALWTFVDQAGGQAGSLIVFLVLARVIGPSEYGVFALAMSLVALVHVVQFYGFSDAIIQRRQIDQPYLSTTFWSEFGLSLALVGLLQLLAHPVAALLDVPQMEGVVRWLSLTCILQSLATVPGALFRRALQMRRFAARTIICYAVGGAVGIVLALQGHGVWALVVCSLCQYATIALVMNWGLPWVPSLRFSVPYFREISRFAVHVMAANAIVQSADRLSLLLVGSVVSTTAVGLYAVALRLFFAGVQLSSAPIERIVLPVLSRLLNDRPRFWSAFSQMVLILNSIWVPLCVGVGFAAPTLVAVLFGTSWAEAAPVLRAMCLTAPTLALWALTGQALTALGKPERFTQIALAYAALCVVLFPLAARFGIVAAGGAWAAVSALMVPVHLYALSSEPALSARAVLRPAVPVLAGGIAMLAIAAAIARLSESSLPLLALALIAGAAAYVLLLDHVLLRGHFRRLLSLLQLPPAGLPKPAPAGRAP